MAQAKTGRARLGEPTLTASDWAEAALQLIAEKGLGALTISTLAARLGVTKGSFYWHFNGREDLLAAALAAGSAAVGDIIRSLDAIPDPRRRLELILEAASQPPRSRSLYAALAEAAEEPVVRKVLQRVASSGSTIWSVLSRPRVHGGPGQGDRGLRLCRLSRAAAARARSAGQPAGRVGVVRALNRPTFVPAAGAAVKRARRAVPLAAACGLCAARTSSSVNAAANGPSASRNAATSPSETFIVRSFAVSRWISLLAASLKYCTTVPPAGEKRASIRLTMSSR